MFGYGVGQKTLSLKVVGYGAPVPDPNDPRTNSSWLICLDYCFATTTGSSASIEVGSDVDSRSKKTLLVTENKRKTMFLPC